jgi:PDZ-binding kinase
VARSPWAVKKINQNSQIGGQALFRERLEREAKILKTLSHPNIIGYRAFRATDSGQSLSICLTFVNLL